MSNIKELVESVVKSTIDHLNSRDLSESVQVDRFIEVRGMSNFRVKFLVKGTSRVVYVQTDRREFIKGNISGRNITGVQRLMSLSEVEEDARQMTADGYRVVSNENDIMSIIRLVMSGLSRRSTNFSSDELVVVSMLQYIDRMVISGNNMEDEGDAEIGAYRLQSVGTGWMVVRPVS